MHDYYLHQCGIERWIRRAEPVVTPLSIEDNSWQGLQQCVASCTACSLHKSRKQTVFGTGNYKAELMFVGEAPGAEEDKQGKPFVGRAGQLLTEMIVAMGLHREEVFIANILKCRPPNNRDPLLEEVEQCTPFLEKQIAFVKPKLLVALGRIAAHFLLKTNTPLTRLRGQTFQFGEQKTPLLVTFHPAYLLRSPVEKMRAYEDLLKVKLLLRGTKDA
jgi:uracil-DNA glycosylase family 4